MSHRSAAKRQEFETVYYAPRCYWCGAYQRHEPSCPNYKVPVDMSEAGNT